jgi:hypothetical protein
MSAMLEKHSNANNKNISSVTKSIGSIVKDQQNMAKELRIKEVGYSNGIKEVNKSMLVIMKKLGYTVDEFGKSARKIMLQTAVTTKETLKQYTRAIGQDINVNKQNLLAMTLAKSSPIFGYFAAKFMETDIFRKAKENIQKSLSSAFSIVGMKIREWFTLGKEKFRDITTRKDKGARSGNEKIPAMASGGYVKKEGLAKIHAAEVVVPFEKFKEVFDPINKNLMEMNKNFIPMLNNMRGMKNKVVHELQLLRFTMGGLTSEIVPKFQKFMMGIPIFNIPYRAFRWFDSISTGLLKFFFKPRGGYYSHVPKRGNTFERSAELLAMIYTETQPKLDDIVQLLKNIATHMGANATGAAKKPLHTMYGTIKNFGKNKKSIKEILKSHFDRIIEEEDLITEGPGGINEAKGDWKNAGGLKGIARKGFGKAKTGMNDLNELPFKIASDLIKKSYSKIKRIVIDKYTGQVSLDFSEPKVESIKKKLASGEQLGLDSVPQLSMLDKAKSGLKGLFSKKNIPSFAKGGVFSGIKAGLAKLHPGEVVSPINYQKKQIEILEDMRLSLRHLKKNSAPSSLWDILKYVGMGLLTFIEKIPGMLTGLGTTIMSGIGSIVSVLGPLLMSLTAPLAVLGGGIAFVYSAVKKIQRFSKGINVSEAEGGVTRADLTDASTDINDTDFINKVRPVKPVEGGDAKGRDKYKDQNLNIKKLFPFNEDLSQTTDSPPAANIDKVAPVMETPFAKMAADFKRLTGREIQVNSAYRSDSQQAQLQGSPFAAPVGRSLHGVNGQAYAIDAQSADLNVADNYGLLEKYGLVRPMTREPWHIQPKGMTLDKAKSGVYDKNSQVGDVRDRSFRNPFDKSSIASNQVGDQIRQSKQFQDLINSSNQTGDLLKANDKNMEGAMNTIANIITTSNNSSSVNNSGTNNSGHNPDIDKVLEGNIY